MPGAIRYPRLHDVTWLQLHAHMPTGDIAEIVGCSGDQVRHCYDKYGIEHIGRQPWREWKSWENDVLFQMYDAVPNVWLAQRFGVSVSQLRNQAMRTGVSHRPANAPHNVYRKRREPVYWRIWQRSLVALLPDWRKNLDNAQLSVVLGLQWREKYTPAKGCDPEGQYFDCPYLDQCRDWSQPVMCELVTVGEMLELQRAAEPIPWRPPSTFHALVGIPAT